MKRIEAVIDFLQKCVEYSDASIERKIARGDSEDLIEKWRNYREFTAHAITEITAGELDDWFSSEVENTELKEHDITNMPHQERAAWLTSILNPRPVALISTQDSNGSENIAPYSSMSVISNTPAIIAVSFSIDKSGRPRDTLLNLLDTGKANIQFLAASKKAALDMDECGAQVDDSEWDLLDTSGPIHPLAIAILDCELIEVLEIPEAVAKLALLKVVNLHCGLDSPPENGIDALAQCGMDQLSALNVEWSHLARKHREQS